MRPETFQLGDWVHIGPAGRVVGKDFGIDGQIRYQVEWRIGVELVGEAMIREGALTKPYVGTLEVEK